MSPLESPTAEERPKVRRSLARKMLRVLEVAAATGLSLVAAAALVLYLDLSVTRRFVARTVNRALAPVFRGRLVIEHLGKLRYDGIDGTRVRVLDPTGKVVFVVSGLRARIETMKLVRGLLATPRRLDLDIPTATIDHVDFVLDTDSAGIPIVAAAFTPVPSMARSAPSSPGLAVDLVISRATVRHAWVHGNPTWAPALDAELTDVEAKVTVTDQGKVGVDVRKAVLWARGLPIGSDGYGALHGRVSVPSEHGNAVGLEAAFKGTFAGINHIAHFSMDGDVMSGDLDVEEIHPENVRPFVPGYPLQDVLSAHFGARGRFPRLDVDVRAMLRNGGTLAASGQATLSERKSVTVHGNVAALDLRGVAPNLPESSLGAGIDATVAIDDDGGVTGEGTVTSHGGTLGSAILPSSEIHGTFAHSARIGTRADGTVTLRDRGLSGKATLHFAPKGSSYTLAFDASAAAPELAAIPRFRLPIRGGVQASAKGALSLESMTLDASFAADAVDLAPASRAANAGTDPSAFAVSRASAHGKVGGSIFLPVVDVTAHADGVDVASFHGSGGDIVAKGPVTSPHVHVTLHGGDGPSLNADADVKLGTTTLLSNLVARVSRNADAMTIRANPVRISAGSVSAEQVAASGAGDAAHGQFHLAPHSLDVIAASEGLDLGVVSRVFELPKWFTKGTLAFDVDAGIRANHAEGTATIDLTNGSVLGFAGALGQARGHADLALHDRRLGGQVHAELGDIGTADLVATGVQIGDEGPASLLAWEKVRGGLQLNADVDIARLASFVPKKDLPVNVERGRIEVSAMTRRRTPTDNTPQLAFTLKTSELVLASRASPTDTSSKPGKPPPPPADAWRIEGIDIGADARIEGDTGFAELDGHATDAKGPLFSLDAKSAAMPYAAIFAHPENARGLLSNVMFEAHLVVPKRDLGSLPHALDIEGVEGVLDADLVAKGTFGDPALDLKATLGNANANGVHVALPLDLALESHYAAGKADAKLTADAGRHGQVLAAEAHFEGRLEDVVANPRAAPWQLGGTAHLEGFPLERVGFLEDRQVGGLLSGDIVLKDFHRDASATADLHVGGKEALRIGEVLFREASVRATLDGKVFDVTAHLDHGDGSADAHAHAGESWGSALYPKFSGDEPIDVSITAKQLRADTILPFAHDTLAELEGRITGNAHLALEAKGDKPKLDGKVLFEHGKFEFGSVFGEFHDATATLVLTPDGLAKLENASASGVTGHLQGAASARILLGGSRGLSLGSARAALRIPSKQPIPVIIEGTPLGTIDGTIDVSEDPLADDKGFKIGVEIPTLHILLPQSGTRSVQGLGEIEDARIEARRGTEVITIPLGPVGAPRVRSSDAKRIEITAKLGEDVEIRRGKDLRVGLSGQTAITVSDAAHVTGQLFLKKGGLLDVEGKSFEIESGSVTFVGDDPSNPQVVVTAAWVAPEGTTIYADFRGPLKTGKVTLRSQPPLAQSDIVSLLLFGTAEGSTGAQQGGQGTTNAAAGLAGGVATQPINHALDQFGVHAVSARVDTSQAANPKPEVALQVARDISIQLAYVLGTPPPGANPDTTLLTLNWRLLKALSLSTTVGNSGSSIVDMVWQRRY